MAAASIARGITVAIITTSRIYLLRQLRRGMFSIMTQRGGPALMQIKIALVEDARVPVRTAIDVVVGAMLL